MGEEREELRKAIEVRVGSKYPGETLEQWRRRIAGGILEAVTDRCKVIGKNFPKIVCLCGSTRFIETFNEWRKKLTLEGKIVLSIELALPQSEREDPQHHDLRVKQELDEPHLRKIDLADEVMILNVGGYIGDSTRRELDYAKSKGKAIRFLEATGQGGATS